MQKQKPIEVDLSNIFHFAYKIQKICYYLEWCQNAWNYTKLKGFFDGVAFFLQTCM